MSVGALVLSVAGPMLENPRSRAGRLMQRWREAVGPEVARHCEPDRLGREGVLTIRVDSPVWTHQLLHMKREILERLARFFPEVAIRDLRFRHGELRGAVAPAPPPPVLPPNLPEERIRAASLAGVVQDPGVRTALTRLLLAALARCRAPSRH
ncbi:MAG: DUF721 domain-containing protein [Magnetococcales bacterium]|nr:DUF721 domain-containing protein [Magnetococcales bacterium]MBF0156253.1 DUF721 domain-containing protein [Magnetococcales bacterium]